MNSRGKYNTFNVSKYLRSLVQQGKYNAYPNYGANEFMCNAVKEECRQKRLSEAHQNLIIGRINKFLWELPAGINAPLGVVLEISIRKQIPNWKCIRLQPNQKFTDFAEIRNLQNRIYLNWDNRRQLVNRHTAKIKRKAAKALAKEN